MATVVLCMFLVVTLVTFSFLNITLHVDCSRLSAPKGWKSRTINVLKDVTIPKQERVQDLSLLIFF